MDFLSPKISFDDINKFETSCGLLFLTVAAASYIYDNNNEIIPLWVTITIAIIGLFFISWGLYHWRERQKSLDKKLKLEIREKENKLNAAPEKKVEEKQKIILRYSWKHKIWNKEIKYRNLPQTSL